MPHSKICPNEDVYGLKRGKTVLLFEKGKPIWVWQGREDKAWRAFCRLLLKWSGNKCRFCGKDGTVDAETILQVHHLKPVSEAPELLFDKTNCIVLCIDCHKQQHPHMH